MPAVWQGGTEDEEVQRLQAGSVLHGSVPAEGLEEAQEVVQGDGGAEEGGWERELVREKQREEGIDCHLFEPSEREVDVGESSVGVWRESTSEQGGEGKEGRKEEIGTKKERRLCYLYWLEGGKRGEADSRQTLITIPRCYCFPSQGFTLYCTYQFYLCVGSAFDKFTVGV